MARAKAFDRDAALRSAMGVFWSRGYAATSTEELLAAMGIGRQSMYDTFGDKQRLFREALELYNRERVTGIVTRLRDATSPLDGIAAELLAITTESKAARARGCFGINTICELAAHDPSLAAPGNEVHAALEDGFVAALEAAKANDQVRASLDCRVAARLIATTLAGMRVQAKAGATPTQLREVAELMLGSLQ